MKREKLAEKIQTRLQPRLSDQAVYGCALANGGLTYSVCCESLPLRCDTTSVTRRETLIFVTWS
jgi:hypothetical protein